MAEKKIRLKIITPNKTVLDKAVDFVLLRTSEGEMGVLHNHEPHLSQLIYGEVCAYVGKTQTDILTVVGGFALIQNNEVTVLSSLAEQPDKIKEVIDNIERERLENKRNERTANLEMHQIEKTLRRVLVHTDAGSYAVTKVLEDK